MCLIVYCVAVFFACVVVCRCACLDVYLIVGVRVCLLVWLVVLFGRVIVICVVML